MKYQGAVSCRLKNRRITLRRMIDDEGNEVNCLTFKRLTPYRSIDRNHIHLSDEALVVIMNLRDYWHEHETCWHCKPTGFHKPNTEAHASATKEPIA